MALKMIDYDTREYEQMLELRNEILRRPLGLELTDEDKKADKDNILIGAFDDEKLLGCCMLVRENDKILLRQMAVLNNLQGKGIGRAVINFAESIARDMGYNEMNMIARKAVLPFYQKLGYNVRGDEVEKLGIPHVFMSKKIV